MKSLLISGQCPYNIYQEERLRAIGVDAQTYERWGIHLPDHTEKILAQNPDIIHLQWPESLTQQDEIPHDKIIEDFKACLPRLKSNGAKIFWVMHNLLPHARTNLDLWEPLFTLFAEHCDVCHHHSECGKEAALAMYDYGDAEHKVIYHGYFDKSATCTLDQKSAREKIGLPLDANIYLSIGALRPDKHIKEIVDCFKTLDPEKHIIYMAGSIWSDYGKEMVEYAKPLKNVIINGGHMADEDVSLYANASDAFIYLYGENHLTSGSPHMSQAHLLPQISLDYGYAREVLSEGSTFIPQVDNRYELLGELLADLNKEELGRQRQHLIDHRDPWHWDNIAKETLAAYQGAIA